MARVTITVEADGTDTSVVEADRLDRLARMSASDLDNVPHLLGLAIRRTIAAISVGRDQANIVRAVAEDLGVRVEFVDLNH